MNTNGAPKLKEYKPKISVLSTDDMQHMLKEEHRKRELNTEKQNYINYVMSCVIIVLTAILPAVPSWNELSKFTKEAYSIITIITIICFAVFIALLSKTKRELKPLEVEGDLLDIEKVTEGIQHTIIMVIGNKENTSSPLKFLCRNSDAFLVHCDAIEDKTIDENRHTVQNYLRDNYSIFEDEIIDIRPIGEEPFFSIKPVRGETHLHAFIVYGLQFRKSAREKIQKKISKSTDMEWLSIAEMNANPIAMKHNYDIIGYLESKNDYLNDSFPSAELHIIWNITTKCVYHCDICATRDVKRKELSLKEKLSILNSLSQHRDRIRIIDFAGGDPCTDADSRNIIEAAIAIFGQSSVSVTTTARGIIGLTQKDKQRILGVCELTIDASHENLRCNEISDEQTLQKYGSKSESTNMTSQKYTTHRGDDYSDVNYANISLFSDIVKDLTINIPILDNDLEDYEINKLVDKVKGVRLEHPNINLKVHLLRLMNVGNFAQVTDVKVYKQYDPIHVAKKIYDNLFAEGISCSYHCSLRLIDDLEGNGNGCTMMRRKIGIDCAGNVFACAWGGYIKYDSVKKNPFYLGNLIENDLTTIIDTNSSDNYKKLDALFSNGKCPRFCPVASIACGGGLKYDKNKDPLAVKYNRKR